MSTDYDPNSINAVLARMEQRQIDNAGKLDTIIDRQDKQEDRIKDLERSKWYALGIAVGVGAGWEGIKRLIGK